MRNIDAIKTFPLTNVPDVIGLNAYAEVAYNNQYINGIWQQLSQCKTLFEGMYIVPTFCCFFFFVFSLKNLISILHFENFQFLFSDRLRIYVNLIYFVNQHFFLNRQH